MKVKWVKLDIRQSLASPDSHDPSFIPSAVIREAELVSAPS